MVKFGVPLGWSWATQGPGKVWHVQIQIGLCGCETDDIAVGVGQLTNFAHAIQAVEGECIGGLR